MDKISNHADIAVDYPIPYLREFENFNEYNRISGGRWQNIEDAIWYVLKNININNANGYWLDLLGARVNQNREILATPIDSFQFDSIDADQNGFGETIGDGLGGKLLEGIGFNEKVYFSFEDELYRIAIKFAIIKNNFDGRRETIINAIKLLTNAERVLIRSNPPLRCTLIIKSEMPVDFQTLYKELIPQIFPQCVEIEYIYQEDLLSSFQFDSDEYGLDNGLLDVLI